MLELIVLLKDVNEQGKVDTKYLINSNEKTDGHLSGCISFNDEYDLQIEGINNMSSYEASIEIANLGYPNIHVENRNMLIYLPMFLSEEQNKWFKENKGLLSRFRLHIMSIQTDGNIIDLSDYNEDESTYCKIGDLKRELRRKELIKQKIQLENISDTKKM